MNRQANPGETIRIKERPWKNQEFVVIICPQQFLGGPVSHHTWVEELATPTTRGGHMYFDDPDSYDIITVREFAMPGDTIEITSEGLAGSIGKHHVVIECPGGASMNPQGCAWHENKGGTPSFCRKEFYRVVKRGSKRASATSIVDDTPVDLDKSLSKKRDELLRGYFT